MTQPNGANTQRVVAKDRLETLAGILNQSANEAKSLHEFDWLVTDRVEDQLPATYRKAVTRQCVAEMWKSYQSLGYCCKAEELRKMEQLFEEEHDGD